VEIAQEKTDKTRNGGYSGNKAAKWSDRRPEKRNQSRSEGKSRNFKRDNKYSKKSKKNYSR
jgi:hypothetical protein